MIGRRGTQGEPPSALRGRIQAWAGRRVHSGLGTVPKVMAGDRAAPPKISRSVPLCYSPRTPTVHVGSFQKTVHVGEKASALRYQPLNVFISSKTKLRSS